jgi:hypothetical protein
MARESRQHLKERPKAAYHCFIAKYITLSYASGMDTQLPVNRNF